MEFIFDDVRLPGLMCKERAFSIIFEILKEEAFFCALSALSAEGVKSAEIGELSASHGLGKKIVPVSATKYVRSIAPKVKDRR
jgi:hypothetical protein